MTMIGTPEGTAPPCRLPPVRTQAVSTASAEGGEGGAIRYRATPQAERQGGGGGDAEVPYPLASILRTRFPTPISPS